MERNTNNQNTRPKKVVSKESCRSAMQEVENNVQDFGNRFPRSIGECVRNSIRRYLLTLVIASAVLMYIQPMIAHGFILFFVAVSVFVAWQDLDARKKYDNGFYKKTLSRCQNIMRPYAKFPDVKKYTEKIESGIKGVKRQKKGFILMSWLVYAAFLAVVGGYLGYIYLYESPRKRPALENVHPGDGLGIYGKLPEYFGVEKDEPFVYLSPLNDSTDYGKIGFFIVETIYTVDGHERNGVVLRFANPNPNKVNYIMEITDKDGNVALKGGLYRNMRMGYIEFNDDESYTINAINYIYTHADELRYRMVYSQ